MLMLRMAAFQLNRVARALYMHVALLSRALLPVHPHLRLNLGVEVWYLAKLVACKVMLAIRVNACIRPYACPVTTYQ
jgi:hypothetical protein